MADTTAHGHPPPNIKLYLTIFGALLVLTVVTVLVSYWHLPRAAAIAVGLAIATFKASLVCAFFMHLKGEHKMIYAFLGLTAFAIIGFFLVPVDMHLIRDRTTPVHVGGEEHAGAPEGETHEMPAYGEEKKAAEKPGNQVVPEKPAKKGAKKK